MSEIAQRAAGLSALVEIGATIAAQRDYRTLLAVIDNQIARLIPSENAAIYLLEPGTGDLVAERLRREAAGIPDRIPHGRGLTGWVVVHGESLLANDVRHDHRFYDITNRQSLPQAMLIAPLPGVRGSRGAICLARYSDRQFTPLDRDLLTAFGQQAGVVLDQARHTEELAALNAIATATATLDLDQVLQELVARTRHLTDADACAIDLLDETGTTLTMRAIADARGARSANTIIPFEVSASAKIIRAAEPLIWVDTILGPATELSGTAEEARRPASLIGAPLIVAGRTIGTVLASRLIAHGFTSEQLRFLETVAAQAAVAVANARLHSLTDTARAEAERRAAGMAALVRIGTRIAAQHDYAALLDTIDEEIATLIPSDNAAIFLVEAATGDLVVDEQHQRRGLGAARVPRGQGVSSWVIEHNTPLLLNDAHTDPRLYQGGGAQNPPHCLLLAPLPGPTGPQGVIILGRYSDQPFTLLDRDLLAAFGQQVGAVLDQARMRAAQARRTEELAALNAIAKATASLDLDEVLQELVAHTRRMLAADTCAITLLDESGTALTARAADGLAAALLVGSVLPLERSFSGEIVASPHALLWHDTRTSPNHAILGPQNGHAQPASMIGVPLIAQDRTIGAMIATVTRPHAFTADHLRFAEMVGNQATIAVENARLYAATLRLTRYDPLTGLANRRYFIERLASAVATSARYKHPLALLVIDIDHFKAVNDTYGHPAGDATLRAVGERLRQQLRESDLLARYGGDELAIILPETDDTGALILAERLRATIAAAPIPLADDRRAAVTLSIGVGGYVPGQSADALLHAADSAMYIAKQGGRNRVFAPARRAARRKPIPQESALLR